MPEFSLKEYKNNCTNTKVKVFIEYLYDKFGVSSDIDEFDNEYFLLFDEDDLIESLEYYISKKSVTAQVTAENYITYIKEFFDDLSNKHNIKNEIFINIEHYKRFIAKSKEIISRLKKSESKNCASDDLYEELNSGIEDYLNKLSINDIYAEIDNCKNGIITNIKLYHRFLSIIPVKLVMKYALKNLTVISLELKNLDMENNILILDDFELPLDEELIQLFKTYLKIREYVLELYHKQESKLFIKHNGEPYKKASPNRDGTDYVSFFVIMNDIIKTRAAELFASRRILEMIDKGIDISTIVKLSGRSNGKCIELQKNYNSNDNRLRQFFNNDINIHKKITIKKKGYLKCPFCGNEVKAISEEWVLVQFENGGIKYLACRECKGKNGKYRI